MSDTNPELPHFEDEQDLIDYMEERRGRELTEQERNLAIAQAKLVGEL